MTAEQSPPHVRFVVQLRDRYTPDAQWATEPVTLRREEAARDVAAELADNVTAARVLRITTVTQEVVLL